MKKTIIFSLITLATLTLTGCGEGSSNNENNKETNTTNDNTTDNNNTQENETTKEKESQFVSYMLNGQAQVIEAKEKGKVLDVSNHLSTLNTGEEKWINLSPNAEWVLLESTRLNSACEDWGCLIVGKRDLSEFKAVTTLTGEVIHTEGFSAISSSGEFIVASISQETRQKTLLLRPEPLPTRPNDEVKAPINATPPNKKRNDLFVIKKVKDVWSIPESITKNSPSNNNINPAISADGTEILFDCGKSICLVRSNGTNLKTLITVQDNPNGVWNEIRYADFDKEGNVVFEADDGTERLWRLNRKTKKFTLIDPSKTNDNSPCVLSNGEIASLWIERPENDSGDHELKIMSADGSSHVMALSNKNITDFGLGCGGETE